MIIADTDVLIDYLHGRGLQAKRVSLELEKAFVSTTAISAFELEVGATTPRQRLAIDDLLGAMPVLPLSRDAGRKAGEMLRNLKAAGQTIGMADCLIAAICMEANGMLLTRNRKHFERIEGLRFSTGSTDDAPSN